MENETQDTGVILQRVIDLLPTRIFWKDLNLVYLGCNKAFAKDAGKNSIEEIIGKTDYDMTWKDQAELYRGDDQEVIDTGTEKINFEEPQTTPNGDTIWLRTSKVRLIDLDGKVAGIIGMYDDITTWKTAAEELKNRTETLERFNNVAVERELKMIELKQKISDLESQMEGLKANQ